MKRYPKSPYLKIGGMVYLPRMLDKMRMHLAGELPEDYHGLRGKGMDERACKYLRVEYDDVLELVEKGWDDEAIAGWVSKNSRDINEIDILIWNGFMMKRGCHESDPAVTDLLERFKKESGLGHRDDIKTFFDYFEADEGRDHASI